ncbi:MAG: metal transporter [Pseudomonadota bacterium]
MKKTNGLKDFSELDHILKQWPSICNDMVCSFQNYSAGISRYSSDFYLAFAISAKYFKQVETKKMLSSAPSQTLAAYFQLSQFNNKLLNRAFWPALVSSLKYNLFENQRYLTAFLKSFLSFDFKELADVSKRQAQLTAILTEHYPQAIKEIEPEYGFHFERGINPLVDESDRFFLYQIMPTDPEVAVKMDAKPVIIIPPYVLGANILGFLPKENRSYAHNFANHSIPTYIRILKDIKNTKAVQVMTAEDDCLDTRQFCCTVMKRHGKPITLNGYCQGGFSSLCNILSGELDNLVDAFITCVSPMDGTRSKGLSGFLKDLPQRYNDLAYGTKTLASGVKVADGKLMGWIYKLNSIESEFPITAFHRDLMLFSKSNPTEPGISKTAAAINYWLLNERSDLPLDITRMSFASFTTPITDDGTLPVKLFDHKLNLKRIKEKQIPWLICYGQSDDLVEPETALAPIDYINAEVSPFPKGHIAIATTWSNPKSDYALHTTFDDGKHRGPVKFQLDLDMKKHPV